MKKLFAVIFFFLLSVNVLFAEGKPYTLTGDVRIKSCSNWQNKYDHTLKCEAIFGLDYEFPEAWMQTKVKISNPFETTQKSNVALELHKLLIGCNVYQDEDSYLDVEFGRNKLDALFESKLQFDNHFNGVLLSYHYKNLSIQGGPHVINSSLNQFGYIIEGAVSELFNIPLTVKYSIADWSACNCHDLYCNYLISQALVKYEFVPYLNVYAAYLINHRQSENGNGFYLGVSCGSLNKASDYLMDFNYQYLESNAVPCYDQSGIGKGFQAKLAYAFTNNFFLQGKIATTKTAEVSAIYKW
jgi:hypothetical protein